jgi:hypothetical protein
VHRPLHKEDELPQNPYINVRPNIPAAIFHLREREARKVAGRRPRLGHQDIVHRPARVTTHFLGGGQAAEGDDACTCQRAPAPQQVLRVRR